VYRINQTIDDAPCVLDWKAPDWNEIVPPPDPALLEVRASRLARIAAPLISLAILAVVAGQLATFDLASIRALLPTSIGFWLIFAGYYAAAPFADWIIFRRLWSIPAAGFFALVRKLIGNELLLGYVGELYFYSWARKRSNMVGAPFGAVKDVAILSAMVGNGVTLGMLAIAWPLFASLHLGLDDRSLALSIAAVLATSLAAMLFRRRLFSLPRPELRFVVLTHLARIAATTGLAAWMWHIALPAVPLSLWLLLSTLRLLLSRLPFVPNKDVVFAGIAVFIVGQDHQLVALMALMAGIILATHLVLGMILAAGELAGWSRRA